ncbi:hypothetical protein HMPREF9098_0493 [Kingella denitrificans ATCC 33394]|uniref:Uncharacterized protein n=1 Tax=Kingella denitrificans ATCC 33394 TaxID=888741 RepID=F0EXB5_9NEIS|nr:hypothetical protein HMPREF9098_0493 [Kingella denitrificans ATCC 33394]
MYALRLAALSHFYFNPLYINLKSLFHIKVQAALAHPPVCRRLCSLSTPHYACTRN